MKSVLKTSCITLLLISLHLDAKSQHGFIDSIRSMLIDLNEQIQCLPINQLLQHTIPYCTGDTMNESLADSLKQLISPDYIFQEGLLQPVSPHLLSKYSFFIRRVLTFFLQTAPAAEYNEALMTIGIADLKLPETGSVDLAQARKIFFQLQWSQPYQARALYYLAVVYEDLNKPDSAYLTFRQSLEKNPNNTLDENILYATTLFYLADFCRQHNKNDSTLLLFQQHLELCKKIYNENSAEYAHRLIQVADLYAYVAKYHLALDMNFKALAITQNTLGEESNQYAVCSTEIGEIYYSTGEYAKSLPYFRQGLAIKQSIFGKNYFDNVVNLHDLATLYSKMGLYNEAIQLLNESLAISKKYFGEGVVYAFDLQPLAEVYEELGDYDKALPLYRKALTIQGRVGKNNFYYPRVLQSMASLFTKLGQYDQAIDLYQQCLELIKEVFGEMNPKYSKTLSDCANTYLLKGDYKQASSLLRQSLNMNRKLFEETNPYIAKGFYNLAALYHQKDDLPKAEAYCDSALQLQKKIFGQNHPDVAASYDLLGDIFQKMHRYDVALENYQLAFEIRKKIMSPVHPDYISSLYHLGAVYLKKERVSDASKLFLQADSAALVHLQQSYASLSEDEKLIYLRKREEQFQYLPSLLYLHTISDPEIANRVYENAIALKSMVLFHQQQAYNSIRKSSDSESLEVYNLWRFDKAFLGQQLLLPPDKRLPGFDSLQDATTQMEENLSRISLQFTNNALYHAPQVGEIIQHLSKDEAAIEFIRFRVYNNNWTDSIIYAAFVLLPGKINVVFVPLFEEKQLKKLMRFSNNTGEAVINYLYPDAHTETEVSDKLYRMVWQPLEKFFQNAHTVYYSPCGLLYKLSFAALHSGNKKLLIDNYNLKQLISTRSLAVKKENEITFSAASLWGNINYDVTDSSANKFREGDSASSSSLTYDLNSNKYYSTTSWQSLPGTNIEIEKIFQLINKKNIACKVHSESTATEEEFKRIDGNSPGLIHIATHGFFLYSASSMNSNSYETNSFSIQQNPMLRSGLFLAGSNAAWKGNSMRSRFEDGVLTAYEISQLDLSNTQLVTLSACETALGDIEDNEGVFGLQRAFKMAGAKQILMSLWKVPDEQTTQLMLLFYTSLLQGNDANTALHNAQLQMKEKYPPYYWAGFIVTQ